MSFRFIFFLILFPLLSSAQFSEKKKYQISKTNIKPKIDGYLDDITWKNLNTAKDFTQIEPRNGEKERNFQRTEVKICFDDKNIYFGVMMYDNAPDSILCELSKRDDDNKNFDAFGIWIDPFNNTQVEYNFMVTAAGVQIDRKFSKSGIDKNWNAIWKSAVKINDFGWSAEFAIPFSQLRFPNQNEPWALNMIRKIRRYREDLSWNYINLDYQNKALQSGILSGIKINNSPLRLSFMPYSSIYTEIYNDEISYPYNYGMDLKYGINESFTLDMTLIPDFGQVASDAMVLNLSPFEVKYEEKRQFFNEGIELFNKGGEMFYSRRLEDNLINASKITGRSKKGMGIAGLNAITSETNINPLKNYNIFILDQAFKNSSSVSIMNTNMISLGNSKDVNVTGLFTQINNKINTHVYNGKIKLSQEFSNDINTIGIAGDVSIKKNSGNYRYNIYSSFKDENYNTNDLGFLQKNNEIISGFDLGYEQLKENKNFISSKQYIFLKHESLFTDNKFVNLYIEAESKFVLKNYLFIMGKIITNPFERNDYYEARTQDFNTPVKRSKSIRISSYSSSDFRKKFAIDIGGGITIKPLYSGYEYSWRLSPRYRFTDKLSMIYVISIRNKFNDFGFVPDLEINGNISDSEDFFALRNTYMITNVLSGSYIINNKMNFSFKIRYHTDQVENLKFRKLDSNGYLYESNDIDEINISDNKNINYSTWTSDISWSWWFAPGSQINIVWKNGIDNTNDNIQNNWFDNINDSFSILQQNSVSLKIVYYLDYLYLKKNRYD